MAGSTISSGSSGITSRVGSPVIGFWKNIVLSLELRAVGISFGLNLETGSVAGQLMVRRSRRVGENRRPELFGPVTMTPLGGGGTVTLRPAATLRRGINVRVSGHTLVISAETGVAAGTYAVYFEGDDGNG